MSDTVPPQLPPIPPPPPLPPAPEGYLPPPVIGWGMGDVLWGLLLYVVGGVVSAIVVIASGGVDVSDGSIEELSVPLVAVSLLGGWVGFVGWPIVASYRKGQRSLARDFGLEIRWIDAAWGLLGGLGALAVSFVGGLIWYVVTGDDAPSNGDFLPEEPGVAAAIVLWILVAVLTPIAEELFFRGLMLRAIGRRWTLPIGVVASSVVFGLFHFTGGSSVGHGLFIVAVTGSYGAVFALLVVRAAGRLGPAIIAHACVNTIGIVTLVMT